MCVCEKREREEVAERSSNCVYTKLLIVYFNTAGLFSTHSDAAKNNFTVTYTVVSLLDSSMES